MSKKESEPGLEKEIAFSLQVGVDLCHVFGDVEHGAVTGSERFRPGCLPGCELGFDRRLPLPSGGPTTGDQ